jgi:hypothetical protein
MLQLDLIAANPSGGGTEPHAVASVANCDRLRLYFSEQDQMNARTLCFI